MDNSRRDELARFLRENLKPRAAGKTAPVVKIDKLVLVVTKDAAVELIAALQQALKEAA